MIVAVDKKWDSGSTASGKRAGNDVEMYERRGILRRKDRNRTQDRNLIKTNRPPGEQGGRTSDRGGRIRGPIVSRQLTDETKVL